MESLLSHSWTGNVRELENAIERAVVLSDSDEISLHDIRAMEDDAKEPLGQNQLPVQFSKSPGRILPVEELVNLYVMHVLDMNGGLKEKTARDLQIDRKTLYRRLREQGAGDNTLDA
jgi:two-component system response regulator HydG